MPGSPATVLEPPATNDEEAVFPETSGPAREVAHRRGGGINALIGWDIRNRPADRVRIGPSEREDEPLCVRADGEKVSTVAVGPNCCGSRGVYQPPPPPRHRRGHRLRAAVATPRLAADTTTTTTPDRRRNTTAALEGRASVPTSAGTATPCR